MARAMAISRWRVLAGKRTSKSPATLAQAISNTSPTARCQDDDRCAGHFQEARPQRKREDGQPGISATPRLCLDEARGDRFQLRVREAIVVPAVSLPMTVYPALRRVLHFEREREPERRSRHI